MEPAVAVELAAAVAAVAAAACACAGWASSLGTSTCQRKLGDEMDFWYSLHLPYICPISALYLPYISRDLPAEGRRGGGLLVQLREHLPLDRLAPAHLVRVRARARARAGARVRVRVRVRAMVRVRVRVRFRARVRVRVRVGLQRTSVPSAVRMRCRCCSALRTWGDIREIWGRYGGDIGEI